MENKRTGISKLGKVHSSTFSERNDYTDALVRKLVAPKGEENSSTHKTRIPSQYELAPFMQDTIQRSRDADYIFEVLPDLEYVAQIAISSILSSKDLITTTLTYNCTNDKLPIELKADMLNVVQSHFDNEYKLSSYLYDILYDVMFKTGSYGVAVIPESSIDKLINNGKVVGNESLSSFKSELTPKGLFGSTQNKSSEVLGLEALMSGNPPIKEDESELEPVAGWGKIKLIDNPNHMKVSKIQEHLTKRRKDELNPLKSKTIAAVESYKGELKRPGLESKNELYENQMRSLGSVSNPVANQAIVDKEVETYDRSKFNNSSYEPKHIEELVTARKSQTVNVGHPLVQHIPSEAIIPVHVPGDFKNQIAYLVLIDNIGNPVNKYDLINSTTAWSWVEGNATSSLIGDTAKSMGVDQDNNTDWTVSKLTQSYADIVERDIINSINNGMYGENATISRPEEVYRIMMARAMTKKSTQILIIPVEQFTYYALDYTDFGIGRSLTDKNKVLTTARAAMMFATTQASILNSTRNMEYTIELDPNDREPEKTIDDTQYRISQAYASRIPFTGKISDMETFFSNAGISFSIEGNEYYPSTKVSVSDNTPDYKLPDESISEDFAKRNYRAYGVDPDLIISGDGIEFATQIHSKDLIATKQTVKNQEKLTPLISHFVQTYVISSGPLMEDLAILVKDHLKNDEVPLEEGVMGAYLDAFIESIEVSVPSPDMSLLEVQMNSYEQFTEAVDKIIDVYIDDDFLSGTQADIDSQRAKALIGNYYRRMWFKNNGIEPELTDMFEGTEERTDLIELIANSNIRIGGMVMLAMRHADNKMEEAAEAIHMDTEEDTSDSADSYGGDEGGDDEFGGGEDDEFGDEGGDESDGSEFDDGGFDDFDDGGDDTGDEVDDSSSDDDSGSESDEEPEEEPEDEPDETDDES